jgi:hypothetical protein
MPAVPLPVPDAEAWREQQIDLATLHLGELSAGPFPVLNLVRVPTRIDSVRCFWVDRDWVPQGRGGVSRLACMQPTEFVVFGNAPGDRLMLIPACCAHVGEALVLADVNLPDAEPVEEWATDELRGERNG